MNRSSRYIPWATAACLTVAASLPAQAVPAAPDNQDLRVLLVGRDPNTAVTTAPGLDGARSPRLYRERSAAFEALLRYHFANVTVVYGNAYSAEMSHEVDVTVFETRPTPLTPAIRGKDPETGESTYTAATYLPADFDRASLFIAENSARIGEPLGSKLDWL